MRDKRFIAEHRGGPLRKHEHFLLMKWACDCTKHAVKKLGVGPEPSIAEALKTGMAWTKGKATVGEARKAAVKAIHAARESSNEVEIALIRSAGHAVATAHMADHSLGAPLYALKAFKLAGKALGPERKWQNDHLLPEIKDLVLSSRPRKEKAMKLSD